MLAMQLCASDNKLPAALRRCIMHHALRARVGGVSQVTETWNELQPVNLLDMASICVNRARRVVRSPHVRLI